jgi:hypothetical protein
MNRKITVLSITAVLLTLALSQPVLASTPEEHHGKAIAAKEVLLTSASLDQEPEIMKDVAKVLGDHKGVLSAKLDTEAHVLRVVFDPQLTTADAVQKALGAKLADLTIKEVQDTTWEKKDCGKCPHAAKCKGKKPQEEEGK